MSSSAPRLHPREKLFDRLDRWVHPIVLGVGKKVFGAGAVPTNITVLEPPLASPTGTVYLMVT